MAAIGGSYQGAFGVKRMIDVANYRESGTSKANRIRGFWTVEGNHVVGKVIEAMILYANPKIACWMNRA